MLKIILRIKAPTSHVVAEARTILETSIAIHNHMADNSQASAFRGLVDVKAFTTEKVCTHF
jgi:hypothetical protein